MKKKFVFREIQITPNKFTGQTDVKVFPYDRIWPFADLVPAIGSSFNCLDELQWMVKSIHLERLKDDPDHEMVVVIIAQMMLDEPLIHN